VLAVLALCARVAAAEPSGGDLDPDELEELLDRADGAGEATDPDDLEDLRQIDDLDDVDPQLDPVDDDATWPVAGAAEQRETVERRERSPIGRVDVSAIWRRTDTFAQARHDEVWLLGTWRL
jgi:hypothetical protein